ncbi:MAG: hypothetical protein ABIQ95_14195 [Bdellovibrionia bacterium]
MIQRVLLTRSSLTFLSFCLAVSVLDGVKEASALDLTAPFYLENPLVLPPGVRNPRFANIFMSVDSKFNGAGVSEPLGNPLNKRIKWSEIVDVQKRPSDRSMIRSALNDLGLDYDGSPGSSTGAVNTYFNVKAPVFAAGITENFTLAVAIPVVSVAISADTGFIKSPDGQAFTTKLCTLSVDECNAAARKLNNPVNEKMANFGYSPIESKTFSNIGDIQIVGKYVLHKDEENMLTLKSTVVLPTGVGPNADFALDVPTGDARLQLGETLVYGRELGYDFRVNAYTGFMALMPNGIEKRIPTAVGDPISKDKEFLTRNMGASFAAGTSVNHLFPSIGLVTAAGYNFQFMSKPSYSVGAYSPERYSYLEDLTPAEGLHSATLMAGFSTVEWYHAKKFVYPFQANFVLSHPFLGHNVTTNDVFSGELVLFF